MVLGNFNMVRVRLAATMVVAILAAGCSEPPDLAPLEAALTTREARVPVTLADTSFGQAVAQSVAQSPRLARSDAALDEARAKLAAERAATFPGISFSLGLPIGGNGLRPAASLTQLIFDAGASDSRQAAAQARVLGRSAGRMDAASAAALEAVEAWADVVTARRLLATIQASQQELELVAGQIAERVEAGAGSSADALTARSRLENQRVTVEEARAELARALAVYSEVFGHAAVGGIGLPPRAPSLDQITVAGSPTLLEAEAARIAALAQLSEANARRLSPISLALTEEDGSGSDASLSAPDAIATGGGRNARIQSAVARARARAQDVVATEREVQRRLSVLVAEWNAADRRQAAAERAAIANRENVVAARGQFGIGRRSLIELLDTEREALAAERLQIIAAHDASVLGYAILAATGDIVDAFGIAPDATLSGQDSATSGNNG